MKLNKVLWYADLEHHRRHGRSLTGLRDYVRLPMGPVPPTIKAALARLVADGAIAERRTPVFDFEHREFVWLREPEIESFSADEIDILNRVIEAVCGHTAAAVSDATHDALWQELANGAPMPIGAAAVRARAPGPDDLDWARRVA
ncbi:MAG: Panacea domain-containing protein [Salinarimonas sp.]